MVINNRPVSDNILRIISERGYKQSAVARKAGYSRQTFGYMVHNTRIIRPEDVQRMGTQAEGRLEGCAHGPALYDVPDRGIELRWNYSTGGQFSADDCDERW